MLSSKELIEQICDTLVVDREKILNQVAYLNGQISYNQKMLEVFNKHLQDFVDVEQVKSVKKASKISKKLK